MFYLIVHVTHDILILGKKYIKKTAIAYKVEICFHEHQHDQNFISFHLKTKC